MTYKKYTLRIDLKNFAEKTIVATSRGAAAAWLHREDWGWDFVLDESEPWAALNAPTAQAFSDQLVNQDGTSGSCTLLHEDGRVIAYEPCSDVNDDSITRHGMSEDEFFELVNNAKSEDNLARNITKLEKLREAVAKQEDWVEHLKSVYAKEQRGEST